MATTTQESAPLTWLKAWSPFLSWPIRRTDLLEPLEHVQVTLRRARAPEKRTAITFGSWIAGVATAASAPPLFDCSLALATTFKLEDEHALKTNAAANTNAVRPHDLTEKSLTCARLQRLRRRIAPAGDEPMLR